MEQETFNAAVIENGVVINVIVADASTPLALFKAVRCPDGVCIGWLYDGQTFTPPLVDP
jgi:hypothetical protein